MLHCLPVLHPEDIDDGRAALAWFHYGVDVEDDVVAAGEGFLYLGM